MTQPSANAPPPGAGRSRGTPTEAAPPDAASAEAPPAEARPAKAPPAEAPPAEAGLSQAALFEVVHGAATEEEIAALTAVLAAMTAAYRRHAVPARGPTGVSSWAERSRLMRRPLAHAPAGWRASARPR